MSTSFVFIFYEIITVQNPVQHSHWFRVLPRHRRQGPVLMLTSDLEAREAHACSPRTGHPVTVSPPVLTRGEKGLSPARHAVDSESPGPFGQPTSPRPPTTPSPPWQLLFLPFHSPSPIKAELNLLRGPNRCVLFLQQFEMITQLLCLKRDKL